MTRLGSLAGAHQLSSSPTYSVTVPPSAQAGGEATRALDNAGALGVVSVVVPAAAEPEVLKHEPCTSDAGKDEAGTLSAYSPERGSRPDV